MGRFKFVLSFVTTLAAFTILQPLAFGQGNAQDFVLCKGDFALCAASTCTPTGGEILVNTANGQVPFPAAACTCPIIKDGVDIVDVKGGNMAGSCTTTSVKNIWSGYFPQGMISQELTNPPWQEAAAPGFLCGSEEQQGDQLVNCFSFNCTRAGQIGGTDVATCTCPIGENLQGQPTNKGDAFFTQAGQCNMSGTDYCKLHPVGAPIAFDVRSNKCFVFPPGSGSLAKQFPGDLAAGLLREGTAPTKKTSGK